MSSSAIYFFGSPGHLGLSYLFQFVRDRGKKPVHFLVQEGFLAHSKIYLDQDPRKTRLLLGGEEPLELSQVHAWCMDGFYVPAAPTHQGLEQADVEYLQVETWATLIALLDQVAQTSLLVNNLGEKDVVATRWAMLRFLASQGLPVPRTLVTSDPDRLQAFQAQVGEVLVKPVCDCSTEFSRVSQDYASRAEALTLAPAHFEEAPRGEVIHMALIGSEVFCVPTEAEPPPSIVSGCARVNRRLGLKMSEFSLRRDAEKGDWVVSGFRPFPSPLLLLDQEVSRAAAELLEKGKES